ncbi:EF-P 5-aminopentanol modification-associated protein YfmF [Tepidanaerobacter syntrophicus]|uniref:EF-P 5-aminopentanol modification-associated protein YfmF n=1 Tax=Tepidanaerobacter syntrophicus TaxID=224999 RepID=UPI001BD555ED|nr:pitrilysin family protein [Tepidanaerobacter syntrophicus]
MGNLFKQKALENNINIHIYPTSKFKTINFYLFVHQELKKEIATKTALLPFVLKRGSQNFPTQRSMNLFLENLYGTSTDSDILKRGEVHVLEFYMEIPNPKFIGEENLIEEGLKVFQDVVQNPLTENGSFKKEYVDQEKEILKRNIESLYNDKFNYVIERCIQEMCEGEPFSIYKYGSVEDLQTIDSNNLYSYYNECITTCPMDLFILGDIDENKIEKLIKEMFFIQRKDIKKINTEFSEKIVEKPKYVEEKQDVNQGKLALGFRTNTKYGNSDYYALAVYNSILGGGPYSKLFQNVREKESLAYYAFSKLEKNKGLMLISSGIEFSKKDKALDIIGKQVEDMEKGNISAYEFDSAVKSLVNAFKEAADSPSAIIQSRLDGIINGVDETTDEIVDKLQKVTKNDVVNVAQKIKLDTIFFLNKID